MTFLKNKKVAVILCVLLVLVAVLFGSFRSLNAQRNKALSVYINGDETGLSILSNLNSISEYTSTLLKTASVYYSDSDEVYAELKTLYETLQTSNRNDPAVNGATLTSLMSTCTLLQTDYQNRSDVSEQDAKTMTRSINDIISMKDQIRHSSYNQLATAFNQTLEGFPAGLLSSLTGVQVLALF